MQRLHITRPLVLRNLPPAAADGTRAVPLHRGSKGVEQGQTSPWNTWIEGGSDRVQGIQLRPWLRSRRQLLEQCGDLRRFLRRQPDRRQKDQKDPGKKALHNGPVATFRKDA